MTIQDRRKAYSLCIVKFKKVLWQPFQTWYVDPFLHACLKLTAFEVSLHRSNRFADLIIKTTLHLVPTKVINLNSI